MTPAATSAPPAEGSQRAAEGDEGRAGLPREVDVAIVGAGFGGLGAAIELERAGFADFAVLERGEEVGGTWWFNSYPGCQCDVPANLYSFSFASKWPWSRSYPLQPEIRDYRYLLRAMEAMRERGLATIEPREDVQEAYNDDVQRRLKGTVWNDGRCASWYLDEDGDNAIMWSDFTFRFRHLAKDFKLEDHRAEAAGANGAGHPAREPSPSSASASV